MSDEEIKRLCDVYEREGIPVKEWDFMDLKQKEFITAELIKRNDQRPYESRTDIYKSGLQGFEYNYETNTYQDHKVKEKWENERLGIEDAKENIRGDKWKNSLGRQ